MTIGRDTTTKTISRWAFAVSAVLVACLGCSDLGDAGSGGNGAAAGGGAGIGGQAGSGGVPSAGETVPLLMRTFAWGTRLMLEDVKICVVDSDNCVLSDANGKAIIDLPAHRELALMFEKEGYARSLEADVTDETFTGTGTQALFTDDEIADIANDLGIAYPLEGGVVRLARQPAAVQGVTFHPAGQSVGVVEDNAFYYDDETALYRWDLDETTGAGLNWALPFAEGGFAEVPPGVHEFEFRGAGDCTEPSWGWAGSAPNRLRLPVREGYFVYGSLRCE